MWKANGPVTRRPVRVLARTDAALSRLSAVHQTVILGPESGWSRPTTRTPDSSSLHLQTWLRKHWLHHYPWCPPLHLLFVCQGISTALFTLTLPTLPLSCTSLIYRLSVRSLIFFGRLCLVSVSCRLVLGARRTQGEAERGRRGGAVKQKERGREKKRRFEDLRQRGVLERRRNGQSSRCWATPTIWGLLRRNLPSRK